MSIFDQLEELKKKQEEEANSPPEEEIEEEQESEEPEEEEESDEVKEEPKEEPKEEKLTAADYRHKRLARDKEAAEKRAAEAEKRMQELEERLNKMERGEAVEAVQESQATELPPEINEMLQKHRMSEAEREFVTLENDFRQTIENYDAVVDQYNAALSQSFKVQNPRLTPMEIAQKVKETVLLKAASLARQGYNPIEEMYHEALELGFTGETPKAAANDEKRPDLDKVAANRQRNAGMVAAKNRGAGGGITRQQAATMTVAEWAALPKSEKARLMRG